MSDTHMLTHLNIALKEWSVVCDALITGEQIILFRKGGLRENDGRFKTEADKFLLFPTFEHQKQSHLKENWGYTVDNTPPKACISLPGWCEIDSSYPILNETEIAGIQDHHIFNDLYITQRFDFNPYDPLTLLILRVHKFYDPVEVQLLPDYLGCRSWIALKEEISLVSSSPVLSNVKFKAMKQIIIGGLSKV